VLYSHRAIVLHSLCSALPDAHAISSRDTILPVVPMFHANAWGLPYIAAFGGTGMVFPGPKLDAESVLDLLSDEQVTITAGVPTVWMAILQALQAEPERWNLEKLRLMIVGGSAVPRAMFEGFDRYNLHILQAWGMTETSPMGTINRLPLELEDASEDEQYEYRVRQGVPSPFGTTRRWVSLRFADRGWRRRITAARERTSSPTMAGSKPATWWRSTRADASASATGPRT